MALAWKQVEAKPEFQALSPQQKQAAQEEYFDEVVAPQAGANANEARQQFFAQYNYKSSEQQQTDQQPQQKKIADMSPVEIASLGGHSLVSDATDVAHQMLSGIAGDLAGGLYSIGEGIATGGDVDKIKEAQKSGKQIFDYQPQDQKNNLVSKEIQSVAEPIEEHVGKPVHELFGNAGDYITHTTGNQWLGALVKSIPGIAMTIAPGGLEVKGLAETRAAAMEDRGIEAAAPKIPKEERLPSSPKKALIKSAPKIEDLKSESRKIYKDLDDSGVTVDQNQYANLVDNINQDMLKEGHHPKLTPKVQGALDAMTEKVGEPMKVSEIETMRKIAGHAKSSIEPSEARLGARMQNHIDDFMDKQEGPDMPKARNLWGRARRADMIDEAMQKAANQASGFENGIRTQLRSLINNKKKMKGFSKEEKEAIDKVVQGGRMENLFKLMGKFGLSEGQRTNALMSAVGTIAGGVAGGLPGAIAVPAIGQVSIKLAQRLTKSNSEMANAIIRSGDNATDVAKAYLKYTPKKDWRASELTQLLINPRVDIDSLRNILGTNPLIDNAKLYATELKKKSITSAAIAQFMNDKSEQHREDVERMLRDKK